ncbi:MAG: MBL fold metallo-hydrolase [Kiritimatiellae bacterium]|nr:MBL fold metallo-hydrolase [Kiritimatiellia bacterium]
MADIEVLGHASVKIKGDGKVVYVDPFQLGGGEKADVILVTHSHFDHFSPDDIRKIATNETEILLTADCPDAGLPGKCRHVAPNASYSAHGLAIRTVPAYNVGKAFHPKSNNWVGYIVEVGGETVYHPGDTDAIPEMNGLGVDVALLPVGGKYTMDAGQAAAAFRKIGAKRGIPIHYGSIVGSAADAERFKELIGQ